MSDIDEKSVMLGQHEARLDSVEATLNEIRGDVKRLVEYMDRAKGSWKTLVAIGGITTAVVEGVHQLVGWLHK